MTGQNTHKDHTEETEVAQSITDNTGGGIPVSSNTDNLLEGLPAEALDYFIGAIDGAGINQKIPPFYSKMRDQFLRRVVVSNDYFLIAVYNLVTKIVALIPTISPLDNENEDEVFAAKVSNELLRRSWVKEMLMGLFDLITQDNGMHFELLDGTRSTARPLKPYDLGNGISVPCIGIRHWDSQRVRRTGNETYPVVITGMNGKDYKVHNTRIISWTDMPSARAEHYGVGLCAASRIIVNLLQMTESEEIVYDMLYDGMVGEIIFGQPFTSEQLSEAFKKAEQRASDRNEPRYRRFIYVGINNPAQNQKFQVERIPLRRLPEDYKKADWVTLFMYLMAAALGIDARETWPATVSGATRADADVQHRKAQNKFTRLFINFMTSELEMKFAPMNTKIKFDFTDAAEELEKAEARKALAESIQIELLNGTITREVASVQMHEAGHMTTEQLEQVLAYTPPRDKFGDVVLPGQTDIIVPATNGSVNTNGSRTTATANNN